MKNKIVLFLSGVMLMLLFAACSTTAANIPATNTDETLSAQATLALGTIQLENTDYAVTKDQASELLVLWKALQTLSNDDTTAAVEINAVVAQIESTMTDAQIQAIAGMNLTSDSLPAMRQSGAIALGMANGDSATDAGTAPAGGPPDDAALLGGGPGGDLAGGTMPTVENAADVTAGSGFNQMQDSVLTTAVVQLLQAKIAGS